ncbi:ATP-binding protein [Burkholderia ubonensis]|uniref:ATP-binding protein n=1 Tax=Burkholderia ubonensis TaxID=101571 RepID=UPI0009B4528B|nr:transporter substrate-binding domain-containing protein [Burkholderia ubonensis]
MSRYRAWVCVLAFVCFQALCRVSLAAPAAVSDSLQPVTRWTGEVPKQRLSGAQRDWLSAHGGVIRVGVLREKLVPLDIVDAAGNYEGVSAEYVHAFSTALDARVHIVAFSDKMALMGALTSGKIDLVTAAQRAEARANVRYSHAYFGNRAGYATRVADPGFAVRPSTDDHVLAYAQGTIDQAKLQAAYPHMRLLAQPSLLAALEAVAFGQAEACIGNAAALNDIIEWHQLLNVSVTDVARVVAEDFRFAVAADNQPLLQMVDQVLATIHYGDREVIRALWEGFGTHYAFGHAISLSEGQREWIARHPVVTYAKQTLSPFILERDDGVSAGFGVDLLEFIGRQTGVRFEPVDVDAAALRSGEAAADVIVAGSPSDPALSGWAFTSPYSSAPEVIVARTTRSYHGVASLAGKKVVVGPGFSSTRPALERAGATVETVKNVWSAADLLTSGIADAWVTNATTANYITQFNENFAIVGETGSGSVKIAFAVRPESATLVAILNNGLASISPSRMHGLRDKWQFSRQVRTPWDKRRPQILTIGLGTLLAVVLFLVWNALLRKEIARRKRAETDLAAAMHAAEDASRAKSTFLATMSHEIRTPMNAVLGVLELLKQSREENDAQSASIDAAYESARALLSLIEDILDLSKIESDRLELATEPTDFDALVRSIANVFDGLARQRYIRFSVQIDNPRRLGAMVDPMRMRQILSNLLSNAVKFTHVGEVTLTAAIRPEGPGMVRVRLGVKDTGIGMSLDEQAKLFQPFVQADRTIGARYGGSGLGLTICKRLVDLMGGTMTMTSAPGVGTSVDISLAAPQAKIAGGYEASSEPIEVWRNRFQSYLALIVDDHPANRLVLSRQLEYLGFRVVCAQDGPVALEHLSSTQFDIVVTDLFMAGMTGYELAREIRTRELASQQHVLLVGCTANAQHETLRQALDAGMDICMTKPLGLATLAKRTSAWLSDRRANRQVPLASALPDVAFPSRDWIDVSGVERIVAGDTQLELKLLDAIVTTNHEALDKLRRAAADADCESFRAASHHLRSGIRLIGADAVVRACESAEQRAVENGVSLIELLPELETKLARLNEMLTDRMAALRAAIGESTDGGKAGSAVLDIKG